MKFSKVLNTTVLVVLLCVQVQFAESDMSTAMMILAILGGFFLGQIALSGFMVLLMAVVPPDARSLSSHHRVARSISYSPMSPPMSRGNINNNNTNNNTSFLNHLSELKKIAKTSSNTEDPLRDSRFLNLLRSDPLNCVPRVMCEFVEAQEPSERTDTINDYKFLMKELLQRDDDDDKDDDDDGDIGFRSDKVSKSQPIQKKKHTKKKNSSPEDSQSSEEKKEDGMAKLLALEEEDALEDKAYVDLINEDPYDIGFALADMKKKEKLKAMVAKGEFGPVDYNDLQYGYLDNPSYKRNLKILENGLNEMSNQGIFRLSRALKDNFVERKKRELNQTTDIFDRTRIAAEVKSVTRSARKCRALFKDCPVPVGAGGVSRLVNTFRKALVGTPSKKSSTSKASTVYQIHQPQQPQGVSISEIKSLVETLQQPAAQSVNMVPAQAPGGTDVKVVLNIGSGQPGMPYYQNIQSAPAQPIQQNYQYPTAAAYTTATPTQAPTTSPTTPISNMYIDHLEYLLKKKAQSYIPKKPTLQSHLSQLVRTSTPPPPSYIPTRRPTPPQLQTNPTRPQPYKVTRATSKPHIKQDTIFPSIPHFPFQNKKQSPTKSTYKIQLKKASTILHQLPPSPSSPTKPQHQKQLLGISKVQQKLEDIIKVIDPKLKISKNRLTKDSDESDSSSEELEDILNEARQRGFIDSSASGQVQSHPQQYQTQPQPQQFQMAQPQPQQFQMAQPQQFQMAQPHPANRNYMGNAYDQFFYNQAPQHQLIPSSQRHQHHPQSTSIFRTNLPLNTFPYPGLESRDMGAFNPSIELLNSSEENNSSTRKVKKNINKPKTSKTPVKNRRRPPTPSQQPKKHTNGPVIKQWSGRRHVYKINKSKANNKNRRG